jgi:hypothetical protein
LRFAAGHNLGREKPVNADLVPGSRAVISQAAVTRLASLKRGPIVVALLHAAFQDVRDAKLPGDLRQVFRRAFVMLRACARDDFKSAVLDKRVRISS